MAAVWLLAAEALASRGFAEGTKQWGRSWARTPGVSQKLCGTRAVVAHACGTAARLSQMRDAKSLVTKGKGTPCVYPAQS